MATEFPYPIDFGVGLRPSPEAKGLFLEKCYNAKPNGRHLGRLPIITNPIEDILTRVSWPWPQLLRGQGKTFLCFETTIYLVDEDDWSTTLITTYDAATPGDVLAITAGGMWQFASFGELWFLTNGKSLVYSLPSNASNKVLCTSLVTVQALASHRTRVLFGGISGVSGTVWNELLDVWKTYVGDDVVTYDNQDLGTNWVVWSERGGGDIDYPFISLLAAFSIGDAVVTAKIIEVVKSQITKGHIGFLPLPSYEAINAIRILQSQVVVYCGDAVYIMQEKKEGYHYSTLSAGIGLAARGAVCGDQREHAWIGTDGSLWLTHFEEVMPVARDIGYKKVINFSSVSMPYISATFNPDERDYYFGNGTNSYVYSIHGLCQSSRNVTSLIFADGKVMGIETAETINDLSIISEDFNIQAGDVKLCVWAEIDQINITSLRVGVARRRLEMYPSAQTFDTPTLVVGSPEDIFAVGTSGTKFKLYVNGTLSADAELRTTILRIRDGSSRDVRGKRRL